MNSPISGDTIHYTKHAAHFQSLIIEQIRLIDPTIAVYCSPDFEWMNSMKSIKAQFPDIPWIPGYHPTRNSIEHFYTEPLTKYMNELNRE